MSIVFNLVIDLYIAAVIADWALAHVHLRVDPVAKAKLHDIVAPFVGWVRSRIQLTFNGVDLSRLVAVVLLIVARTVVAILFR